MTLISSRYENDGNPVERLSDIQRKYIDIFNNKCENKEYLYRQLECECGCDDFEVIAQKDRYGIPVSTVICRNCGLIITNPCLDDNSNNSFYDNEYPFIYRAEEKPSEEMFIDGKKYAEKIVSFIRRYSQIQCGKVLEIGCADGRNVAAFAEKGYDACGIDLSHTYVEFGKNKGLNLFCTDSTSFEKRGLKYDIIVLNHVLEHFTNLGRELGVIRRMLKPDGCLYIGVPGIKVLTFGAYESDFLKMLQNAHIYNFSRESLCNVMKKYGFDCIRCDEFIHGIFKKGKSEISFDNVYEDTIEYLHKVENAKGENLGLLIDRIRKIIASYGSKEVLLYGTVRELDVITQDVDSVGAIKGFFYSDVKTPIEVVNYIKSSKGEIKSLVIADYNQNDGLVDEIKELTGSVEVELYSAYNEVF